MKFRAAQPDALLAVLAKYVVLTRMEAGCRNVDLCAAVAEPGSFLLIEKWDSEDARRAHFDSDLMVEMAKGCTGLLTSPPTVELWVGVSAHDLR